MDKKSELSVEESLRNELMNPEHNQDAGEDKGDKSGEQDQPGAEKGGTETPSPEAKSKLYKTLDGREVDGDQLFEEYDHLVRDYTRKSQELSQLKKSDTEDADKKLSKEGELSAQDKAVVEELRRLGFVAKDELEQAISGREGEIVSKAAKVSTSQIELRDALNELKTDYPFVDTRKVLNFIVENPNTNLSPLQIAKAIHTDDFVAMEVEKVAGSGKKDLPETEDTGVGASTPPTPKYNFKDGSAERAVADILKG